MPSAAWPPRGSRRNELSASPLGLVVGKAAGVTGFAWLAVRLGWAVLPGGVAWRHIMGAGLIGGVGFTVSLFITGLAFAKSGLTEEAKVGVLAASLLAALGGLLLLLLVSRGQGKGPIEVGTEKLRELGRHRGEEVSSNEEPPTAPHQQ